MNKKSRYQSSFLSDLFYPLDLFKNPVYLLFDSKIKVSSTFSILISLMILGFLGAFFLQSDVFSKKRPISSSIQSILSLSRPRLDFNSENMGFAISITDSENKMYRNDSIFTFQMVNLFFNQTNELYRDVKTLENCRKEDFSNHLSDFENMALENAYCPKTGNFTLEGYWNEKMTKYIQIYIAPCDNRTSKVVCQPPEVIFDFFKEKYFSLYFSDSMIDVNNYERPIQPVYKIEYFALDPKITKKLTITFKKVILTNDDGLIFESNEEINSCILGDKEMDMMSNELWTNFAGIIIYSSPEIYTVTRRYQKIQEAIANMGGLANALILFGYFLTMFEKEFLVFSKIMNQIYEFLTKSLECEKKRTSSILISNFKEDKPAKELISTKNNQKFIPQKILPNDDFVLAHFSKRSIEDSTEGKSSKSQKSLKKSTFMKFKTFFNSKKNFEELKFNFWNFMKIKFRFPFKKLSKNEKLVENAMNLYKSEIDIVKIVQKLHEIDKLKMILLNQEQQKLFHLIVKPTINSDSNNDGNLDEIKKSSNFKNLQKLSESISLDRLHKYYEAVKKKGKDADQIDARLVNLIDYKGKHF